MTALAAATRTVEALETREIIGAVAAVRGLSVLARDLPLPVGAIVRIRTGEGMRRGEVVGFDGGRAVLMLFGGVEGIAPRQPVVGEQTAPTIPVGAELLGRVVDALGRPIDGGAAPHDLVPCPLRAAPLPALRRARVLEPLPTGVRAIDAMLTFGRGQRVGVFAGPGVGKSTLLAQIARSSSADVNVVALVGERGREVRDFIETALGPEGLARSVVIVATSDESPLLRVRAAAAACAVAEHFRDSGADVMLMMDSVTRLAQAQRQIGLAAGEQPATKGYPPSVFAMLPTILERAGSLDGGGSITGVYAVLVEGDDLTEPVSDAVRGILDGHVALSRRVASRGQYPAIDVLESISRVADDVCDRGHIAARIEVRRVLAAWAEAEELIEIGAYARGSSRDVDVAIALRGELDAFLRQDREERAAYPRTCRSLIELSLKIEQARAALARG